VGVFARAPAGHPRNFSALSVTVYKTP